MEGGSFYSARCDMVAHQLRSRGIHDESVLDAMSRVPRHEFVPELHRADAYRDCPLPIASDQTISQPYIVALMTQALHLNGDERVLEVGTGSGYQTAILCELVREVFSLERFHRLAASAADMLDRLGYDNVDLHVGDGSQGLPDMAPYDAIIVTAAAPEAPAPLCLQMHPRGGRMVIPVGDDKAQFLELITRRGNAWEYKRIASVRFVPLVGRFGFRQQLDR
jgi:protein-L-isoaspartate(D-aspartate) O-methyltransferase